VTLPAIPDEARLPEEDVQRHFEAIAHDVLGLLLDGLTTALKRLPDLKLAALPRMADFARLACAAAPAFGWTEEEVLAAIDDSAATAVTAIIEGDPVAGAIQALARTRSENGEWKGTATELLEELNGLVSDPVRHGKAWPKDATRLSGRLRRLAPALRAVGVAINLDDRDGHDRTRTITISRKPVHTAFSASAASAVSASQRDQGVNADASADGPASAGAGPASAGADPTTAMEGSADAKGGDADAMRTLSASALKPGKSSGLRAADAADANFPNPAGVHSSRLPPPRSNGDELGLSCRRIQEHADWYQEQGHQRYNDGNLDTPKLDNELRAILRQEVFPEHVEIEFGRVMQRVFGGI
jgi:hypothetical protein